MLFYEARTAANVPRTTIARTSIEQRRPDNAVEEAGTPRRRATVKGMTIGG